MFLYLAKKELNVFSFVPQNETLSISSITYMECLGCSFSTSEEEIMIANFYNSFECLETVDHVVKQTIEIRQNKKIKLPDAIITTTAIVNHGTLITHNIHDLQNVEKLTVINPFSTIS